MAVSHPDAWMPLYVGDYLRDTARLTRDQHGAYLLLIMDYWVNGPPPDDDRQLAMVARSTPAEWRKLRPILLQFFAVTDGFWHQKRLDAELERSLAMNDQRRRAGKASAAAKRQRKPNENSTSVATSVITKPPTKLPTNGQQKPRQPQPPSSLRSETATTAPLPPRRANGAATNGAAEDEALSLARSFHKLRQHFWGFEPPEDDKLTSRELNVVKAWVEAGVTYYPALDFMTRRMEQILAKGDEPPERPQFFNASIREAHQAGWPGYHAHGNAR